MHTDLGSRGAGEGACLQEQLLGSLKASQGVLTHHVPNVVTRKLSLKHTKRKCIENDLEEKHETHREVLSKLPLNIFG